MRLLYKKWQVTAVGVNAAGNGPNYVYTAEAAVKGQSSDALRESLKEVPPGYRVTGGTVSEDMTGTGDDTRSTVRVVMDIEPIRPPDDPDDVTPDHIV